MDNIKLKQAIIEIKEICDYDNEYNSIGIDDYKKMIRDIVDLIDRVEVQ